MSELIAWLSGRGFVMPTQNVLIEAAIAGGIVIFLLLVGLFVGRKIGPIAAAAWSKRLGHHVEGLAPRIGSILRHGSAALLLAILINAYSWAPLAASLIGLALGAATAFASIGVLRGLGIPRWVTWAVAAIIFVAIFSNAIGGLTPITHLLERIGFDVGKRRFSLLVLITALIAVVALIAGVRLANRLLSHLITQTKGLDPTQKLLSQKLAGIGVVIAAFFIGIDMLDVDLTAFAVFSGALGLAVGFGLQKTIGNLIAGIILLMDRSIKPGDVIVVGQKDVGWVNKIGVRAVSVVTRDGKEHLIPNENLMTQEVENWSYTDRNVRVRIPVGVSYKCDLDLAQKLMLQAATDSPRVLSSPKPNVWLEAFGDSSVNHEILAWISDPEAGVGNVRSDVLNRLWRLFKEHDIEIPFPQRDLHIRSTPEA